MRASPLWIPHAWPLSCALLTCLWLSTALAGPFLETQRAQPRARAALAEHTESVRAAFEAQGAAWPPRGLLLVAYKLEGELEVHAPAVRGTRWVHVETIPVCAASGVLGPKSRQGDLQVPEGFYEIDHLNPRSQFHLSLHVNYPNQADRRRIPAGVPPGDAIMVHGNCVTIGCLPLEDGPISRLYAVAAHVRDRGARTFPIHIHPCRYDQPACRMAMQVAALADPALPAFWAQLQLGWQALRSTGRPPTMLPTAAGGYRLAAP